MIFGIGTDLVEIIRIEKAIKKKSFLEKAFTNKECQQSRGRSSFLAGNFVCKEAFVKALGLGFRKIKLSDIEVLRDDLGKPYINLYNEALNEAIKNNITNIQVSISNTKLYCIATVLLEV